MSLQVWLPMTKDLRQQGLSDVTVTNNGATFNSAGKLGGCYSFGTGNSYITVDSTPLETFTEFSFACWVKIISWNTSYSTIFAAKNSTGASWNNLIFSLLRNSTNSTLCFNIAGSGGYTSTNCQTGTLSLNTWYHITCTYKSGQIKLYQDGSVVSTYNTSVVPSFSSIVNLWIGKSNENSYQSNNLLNDVRIYDHCLFPMEVKRLAQGLVLHYPLNRQGWGQENLLNGTYDLSNWLMYGSCSIVADVGNQKKVKYNATAAWRGVWMSHCIDYQNVRNKTVTISGKFYAEEGASCVIGLTVFVCANAIQGTSSATERKYKDVAINFTGNGEWQTVSHTITITDSIFITGSFVPDFDNCYFSLYYSASSAGSAEYYGKNFKMEFGEKITPWCPNSSDVLATTIGLNSTTEYDCSGFCNNGTRTGTFSWTSDTPKYSVSTYFNGSSYIVTDYYSTLGTDNFTIAAWVKIELNSSKTYQPIIINKDTGAASAGCGIYFNHNQNKFLWSTADGSVATEIWTANTFSDIYDKWVHVVMVRDSNDAKKGCFYINGIREELASVPVIRDVTNNIYPMVIGAIGPHNYSTYQYTGNLSDVRVYVTALSAEEVLSLYQNSATIDSNGVIHGQIR